MLLEEESDSSRLKRVGKHSCFWAINNNLQLWLVMKSLPSIWLSLCRRWDLRLSRFLWVLTNQRRRRRRKLFNLRSGTRLSRWQESCKDHQKRKKHSANSLKANYSCPGRASTFLWKSASTVANQRSTTKFARLSTARNCKKLPMIASRLWSNSWDKCWLRRLRNPKQQLFSIRLQSNLCLCPTNSKVDSKFKRKKATWVRFERSFHHRRGCSAKPSRSAKSSHWASLKVRWSVLAAANSGSLRYVSMTMWKAIRSHSRSYYWST